MSLDLDRHFEPAHGRSVCAAPGILRVTAANGGPFTFHGTNSYVVGEGAVAIVDPGPEDAAHLEALLSAVGGRRVEAILLTHTHRDHTALVPRLRAATGAPVLGARAFHAPQGEIVDGAPSLDAALDRGLVFDAELSDGWTARFGGLDICAIATPGHAADHVAFAVGGEGVLLSGDHVMAWSTSVVAPPDGSMQAYMASLDTLLARSDSLYLPGHGGPVRRPSAFVRGLRAHRRMREAAILERLSAGDRTLAQIVAAIYRGLDPNLVGAAGLSVLAHLSDLEARGRVLRRDPPGGPLSFEPA